MDKRKIAVFVGSLREGSFNRQLARALERLGEDRLEFDHVDIGSLPFYNQDFDGDYPQANSSGEPVSTAPGRQRSGARNNARRALLAGPSPIGHPCGRRESEPDR